MVEKIFLKNKYRCILFLIAWSRDLNKKITFYHLKYALVKNYGSINIKNKRIRKNLEYFFKNPLSGELPKYYIMLHKIGEITNHELDKIISKNIINELEEYGWLTEENKFNSVQNLNNYLSRIYKLGLIDIKKRNKKRYPYYVLTTFGLEKFQKFYLKFLIDRCPVEKLDKLIQQFIKIIREK
jgi:hypothetical protein